MHDNLAHDATRYYFCETHVRVSPEAEILVSVTEPLNADDSTPTVFYMPGYRDDMTNIKCLTARTAALESGASFVTLDYRGHGRSSGEVRNESLRSYREDARTVLNEIIPDRKNIIIVGYSIGSINGIYLAHEIEQENSRRVEGIIGIAPVPALMSKDRLGHKVYKKRNGRQELKETGEMTNTYAPRLVYGRAFLHDFQIDNLARRRNRLMLSNIQAPIHIIVAESDAFSPLPIIEDMKSHFKAATMEICPEASHFMEDERSLKAVDTAIRQAVSRALMHPERVPA